MVPPTELLNPVKNVPSLIIHTPSSPNYNNPPISTNFNHEIVFEFFFSCPSSLPVSFPSSVFGMTLKSFSLFYIYSHAFIPHKFLRSIIHRPTRIIFLKSNLIITYSPSKTFLCIQYEVQILKKMFVVSMSGSQVNAELHLLFSVTLIFPATKFIY